ncbi:PTS sugar transporter subunit IIA [Methylophilus sp.]|jgi:mannose PTS system EIIA component|uniref:PTS sugar transporter subunit IIA n=1 Tax=Methylophilus sp. TaxID=29541 RepID=UPI0011D57803|nr:PTS sugar transporter subunit IIA [Methylophilus sp.]TXI44298.1 MAG: PTS sugar transporter subunit IIA [Methylophilus sp.]
MIGVLIIAHGSLGPSLIDCATHVMGNRPAQLDFLEISKHDDPASVLPKAEALVKSLDSGQGVLVLSDIYGATPCNIVTRLLTPDAIEGVAGVNLPMLVRVLNYRHEGLHSCIQKALSGGRDGVVHFTKTTCHHAQ